MHKILPTILFFSTLMVNHTLANDTSGLYIGVDLFKSSNKMTYKENSTQVDGPDRDSDGFKIKFGTQLDDGWRFQGYFLHEQYNASFIDYADNTLNELGLDLIKGFEVTPEFIPFIQAGFGYGWMDVNGYNEDTIAEINLKLGAGMMYKITPQFEAIIGIDLQGKAWQDYVEYTFLTTSTTHETSERSVRYYLGANFHF